MSDPDAVTGIYFLLLLGACMAIYGVCQKLTKRRNRYRGLRAPFDDDRSSIRNFRRMHTP